MDFVSKVDSQYYRKKMNAENNLDYVEVKNIKI